MPLGLLCLLGYFASWALYRHLASQAMSHRHCLLWQCRYTDMPLGLLCLLGFISTLSLSGYVSSTLSALTMPVYWYASWAVPSLGTC
jgi:hypothetical protein